jgi:hypothetical protein
MNDLPNKRTLKISQSETKRALAVFAHLRNIFEAVSRDQRVLRVIEMDHADLLVRSASIRTLFFDDDPILLSFAKAHDLTIEIECLETNLGLLLLSWLAPDELHVSDFLAQVLLDPKMRSDFSLDVTHQVFHTFEDGKGFESVRRRTDVWVPRRTVDEEKINSALGLSNLGGPAQLIDITRRRVPLEQWGKIRLGYLKEIPINRRNLLCYVANKLGGVHYDTKRLPTNAEDVAQFKVLATALDWDNEAIMHAGLVAVGLSCIEVSNTSDLAALLLALQRFHDERQQRLMRGEKLQYGTMQA